MLAIVMFICDTHALLKKDLRNVYVLFTYHSFSRPFMDLPLKTAGVGVLFFLLERPSWFCNVLSLTISQFI